VHASVCLDAIEGKVRTFSDQIVQTKKKGKIFKTAKRWYAPSRWVMLSIYLFLVTFFLPRTGMSLFTCTLHLCSTYSGLTFGAANTINERWTFPIICFSTLMLLFLHQNLKTTEVKKIQGALILKKVLHPHKGYSVNGSAACCFRSLYTMWVASPWGFSDMTVQPARHGWHTCCPLQAENPGIQHIVSNTHVTHVEQVVSSFQKILRSLQLTRYIYQNTSKCWTASHNLWNWWHFDSVCLTFARVTDLTALIVRLISETIKHYSAD